MARRPRDFKSLVSTSSTIRAWISGWSALLLTAPASLSRGGGEICWEQVICPVLKREICPVGKYEKQKDMRLQRIGGRR